MGTDWASVTGEDTVPPGLGERRSQPLGRVRDRGWGLAGPTWRPQSQTMLYIICVTQKQCRKLWKGLFR